MIEAQLESYEMLTLTGLVSPAIQEFVKTMSALMDKRDQKREPTQLELDLTLN
jgi:predicted translin family RNA/ssDNA-binding protein